MRILITGTTSGIGYETAKALSKNHQVIMAVRNLDKGKAIKRELGENVDLMYLDLSSFDSILAFRKAFYNKYAYLDVLINNAGVFSDTRSFTEEGFELTMGVNYVGPYLLTKLMIGALKISEHGRIINVSSKAGFHGNIVIEKDFMKNHPHGFKAYSASKQAQLMFTQYFSRQLKDLNITVNAVHPGSVATNIWKGQSLLMKIIGPINRRRYSDPKDACKTVVYLAESGDVIDQSGELFGPDQEIMELPHQVTDESVIQELMIYTEELLIPYI